MDAREVASEPLTERLGLQKQCSEQTHIDTHQQSKPRVHSWGLLVKKGLATGD
jgi:hypothetical protein